MNINQIKKIVENRQLTPKEKAIICLWDRTCGSFDNLKDSLPKMVLNYKYVFTDYELSEIIKHRNIDEFNEYLKWIDFIEITEKYDVIGLQYFQQLLSLLNELALLIIQIKENTSDNKIFSIILNKSIGIKEISTSITESFFEFFKFLIAVLVNQYFLDNAFNNSKDLSTIKSLKNLHKLRRYFQKLESDQNRITDLSEIRFLRINLLINLIPKFIDPFIDDYLIIIKNSYPSCCNKFFKNYEIKEFVKEIINKSNLKIKNKLKIY